MTVRKAKSEAAPVVRDRFKVAANAAAKTKRAPRKPAAPKPEPVIVRQVHPRAMSAAQDLARGRDGHVEVQRDGTVLIKNGAR